MTPGAGGGVEMSPWKLTGQSNVIAGRGHRAGSVHHLQVLGRPRDVLLQNSQEECPANTFIAGLLTSRTVRSYMCGVVRH